MLIDIVVLQLSKRVLTWCYGQWDSEVNDDESNSQIFIGTMGKTNSLSRCRDKQPNVIRGRVQAALYGQSLRSVQSSSEAKVINHFYKCNL